jgi:hypothetical protein
VFDRAVGRDQLIDVVTAAPGLAAVPRGRHHRDVEYPGNCPAVATAIVLASGWHASSASSSGACRASRWPSRTQLCW